MNLRKIVNEGCVIKTSGTTGTPKDIIQTPEKLKAADEIAIVSQELTPKSKVYTICKTTHAGGLLAQTLPAFRIGAEVSIEPFNAFAFCREIKKYTHTHITPGHARLIMRTKGFKDLDLTGIWVTCGSDPVEWNIIEAFVNRGATFMANWGMSEVGPCAINRVFRTTEDIQSVKDEQTILGTLEWCETKIIDSELHVRGDICVYDGWFATGDLVKRKNGILYYLGRKT
jgi:acyl-CoA synthetase (AMP-forming)/AMP-acid ligase II|tara:strand:+ start:1124 stop:1807 length:684 start_codon:yes stop_codon:yes gene_type:complete